jgi:hypothetical protein
MPLIIRTFSLLPLLLLVTSEALPSSASVFDFSDIGKPYNGKRTALPCSQAKTISALGGPM